MEKWLLLGLGASFFIACSDGDLKVETIDFDDVSVQFCDAPDPESANILFKINDDEALILALESGVLNQGAVGDTIITESAIPGGSQLIYRIFSDEVDEDYFCGAIPPATPTVLEEIEAENGLLTIETVANENNTGFVHTLSLSDVSFVNKNGERLTDVTVTVFGEVTTAN